jgi:glycosyltransferase involved in cell wall biosynthesis
VKIALLHATAWPQFGSAENLMRDQALLLHRKGHQVTVLAGSGEDPRLGFRFLNLNPLSPEYPIAKSVRAVLDNGQFDQNFTKYRHELVEVLDPIFAAFDLIIVHDHFTVHFNLALTQALHDLAPKHRFIAWTHHIAASGVDYAVPNPTKQPWSLMSQSAPGVQYIVASENQASELRQRLKPVSEPTVISHAVELAFLYRLAPEIQASLEALNLPDRDYIFFSPVRAMPRKNLDLAIQMIAQIRESGKNPLLLITGSPDTNSSAGAQYAGFLRDTLPPELMTHVIFVSDHIAVNDEILLNLYQISDAVLYLPRQSAFGLPVIEAAHHRLPIICSPNPAAEILGMDGLFYFKGLDQVSACLEWLEAQIAFRMKRRARKRVDLDLIYAALYEPLFNKTSS